MEDASEAPKLSDFERAVRPLPLGRRAGIEFKQVQRESRLKLQEALAERQRIRESVFALKHASVGLDPLVVDRHATLLNEKRRRRPGGGSSSLSAFGGGEEGEEERWSPVRACLSWAALGGARAATSRPVARAPRRRLETPVAREARAPARPPHIHLVSSAPRDCGMSTAIASATTMAACCGSGSRWSAMPSTRGRCPHALERAGAAAHS